MRRWTIPILLGLALACGGLPFGSDPDIGFAVPERIPVKRGTRLDVLAQRLEVSVDDLRQWNDLTSKRVPEDMEIVVWRAGDAPPFEPLDTAAEPVAVAVDAPAPRRRAARREGQPDAEETKAHLALLRALTDDALSGGSVADGLDGGASVTVSGRTPSTSLSRRSGSLANLGRIESGPAIGPIQRQRDPDTPPGVHIPSGPVGSPSTRRPGAKACLAASTDVALAEDAMAEAQGLSVNQVQVGMLAAARRSLPCFPPGTRGEFVLTAEVTAGCDGRVASLRLSGPAPGPVASCVDGVLQTASFPAHARPDGVVFTYPLRYRF